MTIKFIDRVSESLKLVFEELNVSSIFGYLAIMLYVHMYKLYIVYYIHILGITS